LSSQRSRSSSLSAFLSISHARWSRQSRWSHRPPLHRGACHYQSLPALRLCRLWGYLLASLSQFYPLHPLIPNSGYDSGYINGVTGSKVFIQLIEGPGATSLTSSHNSLITSILSAGTFFGEVQQISIFGIQLLTKHLLEGALIAGDLADWYGRRPTIIAGCVVYTVGCVLQAASAGLGLIVAGRLIAGFGVGFVSAIIILYMSEICPRKVRGSLVSGYQFCECNLCPNCPIIESSFAQVSLLAFSSPRVSPTPPRQGQIPDHTVSRSASNLLGV
jgi:MFS family permease